MGSSVLIKNIYVLGNDGRLHLADIHVENGVIASIRRYPMLQGWEEMENHEAALADGQGAGDKDSTAEVLDGCGCLALPGLVNAHNHMGMTLLRSYADDLPLWQWLREKMWPVEERLTEDDVYLASLVGIAEMIRGGTTTVADIYFHMEGAARAVQESGIRAVLSRGLQGLGGSGEKGLKEAEKLFEFCSASPRTTVMLGPHSPVTCPPEFMAKVVALAKKLEVPLQIHLAETVDEIETIQKEYGLSPVQYLERTGALECGVIAIHCVHVSKSDISILKRYDAGIVHCPSSNLKLGSGIAPLNDFLQAGLVVGLGTDGPASNNDLDMWEEMRLAALLHKGATQDPVKVPAGVAWEMATKGSAAVLGLSNIGELRTGAKADICLVSLSAPHWHPHLNLLGTLVYAGKSADVRTVIIDGEVIYADGEIKTFDEKEALLRLRSRARALGLAAGN